MGEVMAWSAAVVAALMAVTWVVSVIVGDASIVDLVWGLGFALVGWTALAVAGTGPRGWLVVALTTIWGLRLSGYLARRNLGHGEDRRYQRMRERSPRAFWWQSLFRVFLLQGALMWVVSLPVQASPVAQPASLGPLDWLGAAIWAVGLTFEAVGDFQLSRFKADPAHAGEVLDRGLWRYTRHPNYFGDFLVWWGLYAIALSGGAWWTVLGPAVMTILLMKVSGAGLLESTIQERRPAYADYIERTNAFFPGPPDGGGG
jgi:steroid 5-alpha reductase family enzyme